jgi:hypothetical protein
MIKSHLFNVAAGVSLLLALMVGGLWGRSHRHDDTLMREKGTTVWTIGSFDGKLQYVKQRGLPHSPAAWRYIHWAPSQSLRWNLADQATRWYERLGFFYAYGTWKNIPGGPIQTLSVTFPDGSLLLLFLVLPLWRVLAWRKARRNRGRGFDVEPAHPPA